ncbi:MAG: hypothetical protein IT428_26885 [Planctomycetaceae bacterium]|nr:hypothetical protein [Planctomycetaceae bacterium]
MIGLMILGAALLWLAIAIGVGMGVRRLSGRRWPQFVTIIFLVWLPFWDVIPGYYLYQKAVREVAGVRIHQTAKADGYLDLTKTDCNSCWTDLRDSAYSFVEIHRTGKTGVLDRFEQGAGYYTYRLLPRDDERCRLFDSLQNAESLRAYYALKDRCLFWTVSPVPTSQYEVASGIDYYGNSKGLWPVRLVWRRVTDRMSHRLLAESIQVDFFSWIGRQIGIPSWIHTSEADGRRIRFRREDILKPD